MTPPQVAGYLIAGFATGVFSGSLGVGGALLATPLLRFLGLPPYLAVGTTVPVLLPTTLTGAYTYYKEGLVDVRAAMWTALTGAAAAVAGAFSTRLVNGHVLMLATAGLIVFTAIRMIPLRRHEQPAIRNTDAPVAFAILGAVSGFFSGLLGVGGGFIMVPAFIQILGFPTKMALGTSLAVITLTVIPNIAAQSLVGNIYWPAALALSLGVVPGARLGAKLAIRAPERKLRIAIAASLTIVALVYAQSELAALFSS